MFTHRHLILVLFGLTLVTFGLFFQLCIPPAVKGDLLVVTIPRGSSPKVVSQILYNKQVIRSHRAFYYYVKLKGVGRRLRAGSFLFSPTMAMTHIVNALQEENGAANLTKVTIPEGFSLQEIARLLDSLNLSEKESFLHYVRYEAKSIFQDEFPFLKESPVTTLEGYLFPDTYFFNPKEPQHDIVQIMLTEFQKKLIPLWKNAPLLNGSPKKRFTLHQVLTIASMIEKEAGTQHEMPLISSVFYNRLKKKMPLASDPTIIYAMGKTYKPKVYYKDLKIDSPYNTYKRSGFPPSPIASAGVASFKASLAPAQKEYLFFVAKGNGEHYFTYTYRDHLAIQRRKK